jgi:signal peptidase I
MGKEFLHQELEVAQAGAGVKEGTRGKRIGKIFTTSFFSFAILLSIGAVAFTICFVINEVIGSSMMLTLNRQYIETRGAARDYVLSSKYTTAKRGDIVVIQNPYPEDPSKPNLFIKRVIGVGGDRIRFNKYGTFPNEHYKTVVNDVEINESYLDLVHWGRMGQYGRNIYNYIENYGETPTTGGFVPFYNRSVKLNENKDSPSYGKYEIVLQSNEVFVMGDNRGSTNPDDFARVSGGSYDSTSFGPQPRNLIQGVHTATIYDHESFADFVWRKVKNFFKFKWLFN